MMLAVDVLWNDKIWTDLVAFVRAPILGDDGCEADKRVVEARVRHEVGLELVEVHVESTIEAQARGDAAHDLSHETVQVSELRPWDIKVAAADFVHSLVVYQERAVGILNGAVGGKHRVVRFNH